MTAGTAWILVSAIQSLAARTRRDHLQGDQTIHRRKTNDLGGIRHVAVEVPDAVAAHAFIRFQQQMYGKRGLRIDILGQDHIPEEISPYPYKFFYWIDPWGVQWEMERGRLVDRVVKGLSAEPEFLRRSPILSD